MKQTLNVYHISDRHGQLELLKPLGLGLAYGKPDLWINTGDFAPNFTRGKPGESKRQLNWYWHKRELLREIFGDVPVICMDGNHDFCPVWGGLKSVGVNVIPIGNDELTWFKGWSFAGFPHINYIAGEWNYETRGPELRVQTEKTLSLKPDVMVTHSPPAQILDGGYGGYDHYGIEALTSALSYGDYVPKYHFFGHVHEQGGRSAHVLGCKFYNSATTLQKVTLEDEGTK